ncbi:MAG: glycerol-3-phosphate dehydrogenase, partial [Cohnella sp.]|nr:glycerol-3-phosphate dehydrogenase [Cohnella sp.]
AGLRPLIYQEGKSPSDISRKDEIFISSTGLVSIAGGKLTGYRRMAETVVDRVLKRMAYEDRGVPSSRSRTRRLPISGGDVGGSARFEAFVRARATEGAACGLGSREAERLARRYGSNATHLFAIAADPGQVSFAARFGLPSGLAAELVYAVTEEGALTTEDFWIRRTGRLFFDIAYVRQWRESVHEAMRELLHWSEEESAGYREGLERALSDAVSAE